MRRAPILPRRRRWLWRSLPLLGLTLAGWGCQQPPCCFYYGQAAPACVPVVPAAPMPVNGQAAPPTEVIEGGSISSDVAPTTTTITDSTSPRRVVVSQPTSRQRSAWRLKPEPDPVVATTSVDGGVPTTSSGGNSSVNR